MCVIHCSLYSVVDTVVYMIVCMFIDVLVCMNMYKCICSGVHECVCVCRCVQWHECIISEHTNCQYVYWSIVVLHCCCRMVVQPCCCKCDGVTLFVL